MRVNRSFHNSTNARGAELKRLESETERQDDLVAALFRKHSPFALSPSQAHRALATRAPLTSIRRAITNLTNARVLVKTDEQCVGPYGRREYRWKFRPEPEQVRLL